MKISLNWIHDFIDISAYPPESIAREITMKSAEIENSYPIGRHFEQVKAAKIVDIQPHPKADKLQLATVFDGEKEVTVVCGAPNIQTGQIVPFAPLGTVLPGNFEIKPVKIRGIESTGMLCAEDELGLGEDHQGILLLDQTVTPGTPLTKLFGKGDYILEVENKTINHRPDMWGHIGFAREIRAIFKLPWKHKPIVKDIVPDTQQETVVISAVSDNVLYYGALRMSNITVAESPDWLKQRLSAVGLRPINNIVDITNYVMMETGHPMHAFDFDTIEGNTIIIRDSTDGEPFISLDGRKHTLSGGDVVIADNKNILALGGVMGGENSQVTEDTTELLIESALFKPAAVRKTASKYDLRTDSSSRFEKALWVENAQLAMSRFVQLVKEIVPKARITSAFTEEDKSLGYGFNGTIAITPDYIRSLLGISFEELSNTEMKAILELLDFTVSGTDEAWEIAIPPHRRSKDISIKQDIVEEVGRMFGFNNIKPRSPLFPNIPPRPNRYREVIVRMNNLMALTFGGYQVVNYLFVSEKDLAFSGRPPEGEPVRTAEEREQPWLRTTLIIGLLNNVKRNAKQYDDFTLFEVGSVFSTTGEWRRYGIVKYTNHNPYPELKRMVTAILQQIGVPQFSFEPVKDTKIMNAGVLLHPGRGAVVKALGKQVAVCGEIHPEKVAQRGIKGSVGYVEFDIETLLNLPKKSLKFKELNKFPSTSFDVTVIMERGAYIEDVLSLITKNVPKNIRESVEIIDRFEGGDLPEGSAAVSVRISLNGQTRTLSGDEMKTTQDRVRKALKKNGYTLRGE